ncbi:MAG: glycosyltransferase family 39 protein [Pseudomonadota bacterium]
MRNIFPASIFSTLLFLITSATIASSKDPAQLLQPLAEGAELGEGWILHNVEARPDSIIILIGKNTRRGAEAVEVRLLARDDAKPAFAKTRSFNIVYSQHAGRDVASTPEDLDLALKRLSTIVGGNDDGQWLLAMSPDYYDRSLQAQPVAENGGPRPSAALDLSAGGEAENKPRGLPGQGSVMFFLVFLLVLAAGFSRAFREAAAGLGDRVRGFAAHRAVWFLAAIVVLAFALRAWRLDVPFSADMDVQRIFIASRPLGDIVRHNYEDARHPQLTYILLHGAQLVSIREDVMRMPALLFSLLSIVLVFNLARRAFSVPAALFAAVILAVSPHFVFHGRQVSDTAFFTFLVLCAAAAYERAGRSPGRRSFALLAIVNVLMLYTYYLAGVALLAQAAAAAMDARRRRHWKHYLAVLALVLAAASPALADLFRVIALDTGLRQAAAQFPHQVWGAWAWQDVARAAAGMALPMTWTAFVAGASILFLAAAAIRMPGNSLMRLCGLLTVLPVTALLLAAGCVRVMPYYAVFALPCYALLLAGGLDLVLAGETARLEAEGGLGRFWRRAAAVFLAAGCVLAFSADLSLQAGSLYSGGSPGRDVKDMAGIIDRAGRDRTIVCSFTPLAGLLIYYASPDAVALERTCVVQDSPALACERGGEKVIALTDNARLVPGWEEKSGQALLRVMDEEKSLWFVYNRLMPDNRVYDIIAAACRAEAASGPLLLYSCGQAATH